MYKKTITYTDYNDQERTEDFYFNLNKAELLEMQMSVNGGYEEYIKQIIKTRSQSDLIKIFKELILKSYGVKSLDGKHFIKNDQVRDEFTSTEAYSELFTLLANDDDEAAAFINGVIPQSLRDQINKEDMDKAKKEMLGEKVVAQIESDK